MKHVHHVPESCLRHCIEGVSEVDVDSIDSLSLSVGEIKVVPVGKFAALRPGRRAAVFAHAMAAPVEEPSAPKVGEALAASARCKTAPGDGSAA